MRRFDDFFCARPARLQGRDAGAVLPKALNDL
jgi:hypothetical protein